jgi:hypothetical protein
MIRLTYIIFVQTIYEHESKYEILFLELKNRTLYSNIYKVSNLWI